MSLKIFLSLLLITTTAWSQSQNCRVGIDPLKAIQQSAAEILKKAQVQEFENDPQTYCQRNVLLRFINVNNNKFPEAKDCEGKSVPELEAIADKVASRSPNTAWTASLIPTEASMANALKLTSQTLGGGFGLGPELTVDRLNAAQHPDENQMSSIATRIDGLNQRSVTEQEKRANGLQKGALCIEMSLLHANSCAKGLDIILDTMMPKQSTVQIMNLPSWRKVLTNPKWQEGLRIIGIKLIERLKSNASQPGNVFDDLMESFQKSGLTKEESVDASFKVMGVVASGGANTCQRAQSLTGTGGFSGTTTPAVASLCLLGTAMNVFDFKRMKAGQPPYSYPKNVKAGCYYPKPYHFWMSADISRSLILEHGIDPKGAAIATFLAQKGYQINRDTTGGGSRGLNSVFNKNAFDPVHQVIRMDLAYAAAGAQFGISKDSKFDVDNGLKELLAGAEVRPPEVRDNNGIIDTMLNLKHWNQIFSPNSAFEGVTKSPRGTTPPANSSRDN